MSSVHPVFKALREMSMIDLNNRTDAVRFRQGMKYLTEQRVQSFSWETKGNALQLVALLNGSEPANVLISLVDGKLQFICSCSLGSRPLLCKHSTCTFLTILTLLHNEEFARRSRTLFKELAQGEKAKGIVRAPLTIHLEHTAGGYRYFTVSCLRNGKKLSANALNKEPLLQKLAAVGLIVSENCEDRVLNAFDEYASTAEDISSKITIKTDRAMLDVRWNRTENPIPFTELDLVGNGIVHMRRCLRRNNQTMATHLIRISKRIFVDTEEKQIIAMQNAQLWAWQDGIVTHIQRTIASVGNNNLDDELLLPEHTHLTSFATPDAFSHISDTFPLRITGINRQFPLLIQSEESIKPLLGLKKQGIPVAPVSIKPTLVINGVIHTDNRTGTQYIHLRPQVYIARHEAPFFQALAASIGHIDLLPSWVRTKGRRPILFQALLNLAKAPAKRVTAIIDKSVKELLASFRTDASTHEIKSYLQAFYTNFFSYNYGMIFIADDAFYQLIRNYQEYLMPACLIFDFFKKPLFETDKTGVFFLVPLHDFYAQFAQFKSLLEKNSVELQLNGKRLESMTIDVTVDASQASTYDWLEITPQISAHGIELTQKQREALFSADGFIESAECITILDQQSRDILKTLAAIFRQNDQFAPAKKDSAIIHMSRLRVLDLLELRHSGAKVTLSPEDEELVQRLVHFSAIKQLPLPKKFTGELRPYQKAGYQWLAFLYGHRFGACLADDMGLGKTVQAIAFLGGIAEAKIESPSGIQITGRPHAIVVPPTLLFNWQKELHTFYPTLRVKEYKNTDMEQDMVAYDVILITYDRVRLDIERLKKMQFHVLILDEAQAIKNIHAARTCAVRQLKSIFTLSITGTPLENHIGEYYSIIDTTIPGLLPEYKKFMQYTEASENDTLIKKTKPFVLRRTKSSILKDLPAKVESNTLLNMTSKQQKIYATTVTEVKKAIDNAYTNNTAGQARIIALTAILRLRQICIAPQMLDPTYTDTAPKIDHLIEALTELVSAGNAGLVFSQFTTCLDIIEKELKKAGLVYHRIDGSTPMARRKKIVESFQNAQGAESILLLSLKTGGVGLNLTRANHVFHVDPWWNPAVENQASDRSHRIGQKNTVFVTRLLMHHTIEEKMMILKEAKQKLFQDVLEHAENKGKDIISKQDFDMLLS